MKRSQLLVSMSAKCSIERVNKNKSTWKLTHLCVLIRHVVRWDQISLNRTQLFIRGALLHTKSMDKMEKNDEMMRVHRFEQFGL